MLSTMCRAAAFIVAPAAVAAVVAATAAATGTIWGCHVEDPSPFIDEPPNGHF